MAERLSLFATTPRGTESLLASELGELGAHRVRQDRGGVRFAANLTEALRVCLWTRLAMRVLLPVGEAKVRGAQGLYDAVRALPWEEHLTAHTTFAVDASLKDSEHAHSGFVALKVKDAIADRLRDALGARPDVDTRDPNVRVVCHLAREQLSVSLDLCGEPLNRRGYRRVQTKAPLKETLAAAVLRAARYTGDEPLFDPMCGSGTLLLEAGLIATQRAPSAHRSFAIERWPGVGEQARATLAELREEAKARLRKAPFPIVGTDRDPEVVDAASKNVQAARLREAVRVLEGDALHLSIELPPAGLLVTNPPYGERLDGGGQKGMKSFYFKLGESLGRLEGWRQAILCGNPAFESAYHHRPSKRLGLWNGPLECQLLLYPARRPPDGRGEPDQAGRSHS